MLLGLAVHNGEIPQCRSDSSYKFINDPEKHHPKDTYQKVFVSFVSQVATPESQEKFHYGRCSLQTEF